MTTLLVETLINELEQVVNLKINERYSIAGIYPYIYLHNSPPGTFTFEIINSNEEAVFSRDFTSSDIKDSLDTTDDYAHVFFPIVPGSPLQLDAGQYTLKLSGSGYSANMSSFLGWCRQFEDLNNILDYEPMDDGQNPLAVRLKVYKRGINA